MGKDVSPDVNKITTISSFSATSNSKSTAEASKIPNINKQSMSINNLIMRDGSIIFDELISSYPGRRAQILELISLLGPPSSPMIPLFIYGGASTGKTSTILEIFKYLKRPFTYCSCVTCYSPRILFESILNQLLLHTKNGSNGYLSAKRCEKPSDFVILLREALSMFIDRLKGNPGNGKMVYLVFDHVELVREWDKSSVVLPFLFSLYDILKMSEVGLIFLSRTSPDTFLCDPPFPVFFPEYTVDELRQIFMNKQANPKLYSSFLDLVLMPFCRITRKIDALSAAFSPLFKKYCEPLGDLESVPNEDMRRKLFSHLQPFMSLFLNQTFSIPSKPLLNASANTDGINRNSIATKLGIGSSSNVIDFYMSTSAKYMLISAFLASRNPATLDASLFDSTGGYDGRKRMRKNSYKTMDQKETKDEELLLKGPGTFPLERLLAIFQCISSDSEYSSDDEELQKGVSEAKGRDPGLMSDILLQLSSLCNANFISKGITCPLEGSSRYRSTVSEDMALKVSRSLKFPLSKYMYR